MSNITVYNPAAKHFINDPSSLVVAALKALTRTNPNVALDEENKVVYTRPNGTSQVSIVSGGGAGHEPSFSAFVGHGLLAGAVSGTIFASPSAEQVRRCIQRRVDSTKGVLVVVMNYTGDVLNFGMAVEKAKASGKNVAMVVVGDDAGVERSRGGKVGRRGIAGTVLVQKIAGALAATGAELKDVHSVASLVANNVVSIGSSLAHVHVPGRKVGSESDEGELAFEEAEIGMGIHNEAGVTRSKTDLKGTVKTMLKYMLDTTDKERGFLDIKKDDQTVVLVNNLGGLSVLEMGGITDEVLAQLSADYNIKPARVLSGTYMTSLNMLGFSISVLRLADTGLKHSMLQLLDAPAEATGWSAAVSTKSWETRSDKTREDGDGDDQESKPSNLTMDPSVANNVLKTALERVVAAEPDITHYDTIVGDGDCGIGLRRGAEGILDLISGDKLSTSDAAIFLDRIIGSVEVNMDGTSGAIYAIFLNALATGLRSQSNSGEQKVNTAIWGKAAAFALESMGKYTPAKPGDRTLVDALAPFVETLKTSGDLKKAAEAAQEGADHTKGMKASLGRTVYVGGEGYQQVPDPGAYGLSKFLSGLAEGTR
ncbi:hypothetical protein AAFC00_006257 [Neodothiora populina]|uniref:Dihydroxyacetone kinase n=1 Tax=Neodothiora populina TaxID=2781224 RepID=A0ABR3P4X0_9PEZI